MTKKQFTKFKTIIKVFRRSPGKEKNNGGYHNVCTPYSDQVKIH